jgi:predicted RNase H-like HicB family nuclease
MADFPTCVKISYKENKRVGLVAAVSADLPGLMAVGTSMEEADARVPAAIAQIIEAQYGVSVDVKLFEDSDDDGFSPVGEKLMELRAA